MLEQANVLLASVLKVFLKVLIVRLALAAKSCDQREENRKLKTFKSGPTVLIHSFSRS